MVDAACRPILLTGTGQIVPIHRHAALCFALFPPLPPAREQAWCTTSKQTSCAIRQSLDRQRWSTFHVELAETGVLHLAFIYWCTNASPNRKQGKSITTRQHAINDRPLPNLANRTACNLTPSTPVSHSPGLACNLTRLHLNPSNLPSAAQPADQSINQLINVSPATAIGPAACGRTRTTRPSVVARATHWVEGISSSPQLVPRRREPCS